MRAARQEAEEAEAQLSSFWANLFVGNDDTLEALAGVRELLAKFAAKVGSVGAYPCPSCFEARPHFNCNSSVNCPMCSKSDWGAQLVPNRVSLAEAGEPRAQSDHAFLLGRENLAIPDIVAFHGNIQLGDGILVPRSPFDASQDLISISTRFELMLARPAFLFLYIRRNDRGNGLHCSGSFVAFPESHPARAAVLSLPRDHIPVVDIKVQQRHGANIWSMKVRREVVRRLVDFFAAKFARMGVTITRNRVTLDHVPVDGSFPAEVSIDATTGAAPAGP